jgi:uncharacterized protein
MKKLFLYAVSLLSYFSGMSQSKPDASAISSMMTKAARYMSGGLTPYEPKKAFDLYMQCALAGNAQAMNALGIQYKNGLGIDSNATEALAWFNKAAGAGYAKAWYNLGLIYKYGNGVQLNYETAYNYFRNAADAGLATGYYAQGYMLYKGLGCPQDYKKAFALFRKGILQNNMACMHFAGLCLSNGWGVEKNADSAAYWFKKAGSLGYTIASDQLIEKGEDRLSAAEKINTQNALRKAAVTGEDLGRFRRVNHSAKIQEIAGDYTGYLVKYDYSGEHVMSSQKIMLKLADDNGTLKGWWIENDTLKVEVTAVQAGNALLFKNTSINRKGNISATRLRHFDFEKAKLKLLKKGDSLFMVGNMYLFSTEVQEPEKPLYVILTRSQTSPGKVINEEIEGEALRVSPNPFTTELVLQFTKIEDKPISVALLSMEGKTLYTRIYGRLGRGMHTITWQPGPLSPGTYLLKFSSGENVQSMLVIRK